MTIGNNSGPPGGDGARPKPGHAEPVAAKPPNADKHSSRCSAGTLPWRRRREASRRMPPLDCGCADPWLHTCVLRTHPPVSERTVDAYRDTVLHLRHCGLLAAPNIPAMRVLWRRSDDDRQLMDKIAQRWELAG